ncbi:MAG: hypothetical protein PUC06_05365 [Oscillospiraceae bacterium]|nr:hypothetical protein [Oscillospiraceae bacterium]
MNEQQYDAMKTLIYELMIGMRCVEQFPFRLRRIIRDEFSDRSIGSTLYEDVYNANLRICERLGVEEDADIDILIDSMLQIAKHLSMQMFEYGKQSDELFHIFLDEG